MTEINAAGRPEDTRAAQLADGEQRALLERAEDALHSIALDLLAVSPHLKVPYTDMPEASPWSMFTGPQARRAHDLAMEIRKYLGLAHRWRTRAAGTPPLEERDVAAAAIAETRQLAGEILATFTRTDAGYRARVGQVQIARWREQLGSE